MELLFVLLIGVAFLGLLISLLGSSDTDTALRRAENEFIRLKRKAEDEERHRKHRAAQEKRERRNAE